MFYQITYLMGFFILFRLLVKKKKISFKEIPIAIESNSDRNLKKIRKLGSLLSADIGVFQILGKNSDDKFTWGGTLNLFSKDKTAYVTVKQKYSIK